MKDEERERIYTYSLLTFYSKQGDFYEE